MIFAFALLHAHDHVAIHLDEAAITIPRETFVFRRLRQRENGFVIQAEVQNRIHHARHRIARAGTNGHEQRHRFVSPNLLPMIFSMLATPASICAWSSFGIGALVARR